MIRAIIYDMDGVITDSEYLWAAAYRRQLARYGKTPPRTAAYRRFVNTHYRGRNQRHAITMMKRWYGIQGNIADLSRERVDLLLDIFDRKLKLVPGIRGLLAKTKRHYHLALASSSPRRVINYTVRRYSLRPYFRTITSGDDFHHSKPDPEIFLTTARHLGIRPPECLVIEDSMSGVQAARRARMRSIGLRQPYNSRRDLQQADVVIQRLFDITLPLIRSL